MRLLVAENDPALARFLYNSFDAEHYAVDLTRNSEEAKQMVRSAATIWQSEGMNPRMLETELLSFISNEEASSFLSPGTRSPRTASLHRGMVSIIRPLPTKQRQAAR